jgi:hypothetical protein
MEVRYFWEGGMMFVELQHPNSRDAMYANHTRMTVDALVMIFEFDRASA